MPPSLNVTYVGTLSQFTTPDETCPGDPVTFTCVVNSDDTRWTVSPDGGDGLCLYQASHEDPDACGPGSRFRSSRTEGSASNFNSSLSVAANAEDFNRTQVNCTSGDNDALIGSGHICITGKFIYR